MASVWFGQYWQAVLIVVLLIVSGVWVWLTDRERAITTAKLIARQVVLMLVTASSEILAEITDAQVAGAADALYVKLPAWVRRFVTGALFQTTAIMLWHEFKDELAKLQPQSDAVTGKVLWVPSASIVRQAVDRWVSNA